MDVVFACRLLAYLIYITSIEAAPEVAVLQFVLLQTSI